VRLIPESLDQFFIRTLIYSLDSLLHKLCPESLKYELLCFRANLAGRRALTLYKCKVHTISRDRFMPSSIPQPSCNL
jgi:hypothetical protein